MKRTVNNYMTPDPITIDFNESLEAAIIVLEDRGLSHLLVTKEGRLEGVISKTDVLDRLKAMMQRTGGEKYNSFVLKSLRVWEFMTKDPVAVEPDEEIDRAVEILLEQKFHILPVMDATGKPVGVITAIDLLKGMYHQKEETTS